MAYLQERHAVGEIVTGLLYVDPAAAGPARRAGHGGDPAQPLDADALTPGAEALDAINESYR